MLRAIANVAAEDTDEPLTDPVTSQTTAGVAGMKWRVYAAFNVGDDTATDVTFTSVPDGEGSSTAISPVLAFGSSSGISLPYNPYGWFETLPGEGLGVTTGAGATQGVLVTCQLLPAGSN